MRKQSDFTAPGSCWKLIALVLAVLVMVLLFEIDSNSTPPRAASEHIHIDQNELKKILKSCPIAPDCPRCPDCNCDTPTCDAVQSNFNVDRLRDEILKLQRQLSDMKRQLEESIASLVSRTKTQPSTSSSQCDRAEMKWRHLWNCSLVHRNVYRTLNAWIDNMPGTNFSEPDTRYRMFKARPKPAPQEAQPLVAFEGMEEALRGLELALDLQTIADDNNQEEHLLPYKNYRPFSMASAAFGGRKLFYVWEQVSREYGHRFDTICEVGIAAGHSSVMYLAAQPTAKLIMFDYHDWLHFTQTGVNYLLYVYGNRVQYIPGPSAITLRKYRNENPQTKCDLVSIDGSKSYHDRLKDFENMRRMASSDSIWILDDSWPERVLNASYSVDDLKDVSLLYRHLLDDGFFEVIAHSTQEMVVQPPPPGQRRWTRAEYMSALGQGSIIVKLKDVNRPFTTILDRDPPLDASGMFVDKPLSEAELSFAYTYKSRHADQLLACIQDVDEQDSEDINGANK